MKPHTHVYIPNGTSEICVHCGLPPDLPVTPAHLHWNGTNWQTVSGPKNLEAAINTLQKTYKGKFSEVNVDGYPWLSWEHEQFDH